MFYKPKYCCHCGEKIERLEWRLLASRRFCEVCESDFAAREWLARAFVCLMAAVGVFGFGSYLRAGAERPVAVSSKQSFDSVRTPSAPAPAARRSPADDTAAAATANRAAAPRTSAEKSNKTDAPSEEVYFCGAATKKGTACSRRVKGGGRCWQHRGAAAAPTDKRSSGN